MVENISPTGMWGVKSLGISFVLLISILVWSSILGGALWMVE